MKNFLLLMQDAKNAPWAEGTNLTKAEYIVYVRQKDAETQVEKEKERRREVPQLKTPLDEKFSRPYGSQPNIVYHDFDYTGYKVRMRHKVSDKIQN